MLNNIALGQYFHTDSYVHRLDPRTKLLAIFLYMPGLFLVTSPVGYVFYLVFTLFVIYISKIPFKLALKSIKPLWLIILITALLHFFMTPGKILWQFYFFKLTEEGIRQGIFMTLRLVLIITFTSLLTLTTTPINLTDGLERILRPFQKIGLPAHELAMMMTIALRFIPTLAEELDKIMKAQMARGADFETKKFSKRIKILIPILVPLFVSAFRRADELALAMEARCYRGGEGRTRMQELSLTLNDYLVMLMTSTILALTLILHFMVKI